MTTSGDTEGPPLTAALRILQGRALPHQHLVLLAGGAGQAGIHEVGLAGEGALGALLAHRVLRVLAGEHEAEPGLAHAALAAAPAGLVLEVSIGTAAEGIVRLHAGGGHALQPHALRARLARLRGAHRVREGDTCGDIRLLRGLAAGWEGEGFDTPHPRSIPWPPPGSDSWECLPRSRRNSQVWHPPGSHSC